jgi:hypothetical protein
MNYEIREVHQAASGGSHVVIYQAELEVLNDPNTVEVTVLNLRPEMFERSEDGRALAAESIRSGAIVALSEFGKGARIEARNFVIHPVDFKPSLCAKYTAMAIRRLLSQERMTI